MTVSTDGDGTESGRTRFTSSQDVPGRKVRVEFRDKTSEHRIAGVAFEKK